MIGKERKSENIKRKNLTGIQGKFQRTDTLETKEDALETKEKD